MIDPPVRKRLLWSPALWAGLGLLALLLQHLGASHPQAVEAIYSQTVFPVVRAGLDAIVGRWSVAVWPVLVLLVISLLALRALKVLRSPVPMVSKVLALLRGAVGAIGALVFFFFVLWGYNYQRVPLEERMGINPDPLTVEQTFRELEWATFEVVEARTAISADTLPLEQSPETLTQVALHQASLAGLRGLLTEIGIPASEELTAREVRPEGLLLRISTAGFYFPLTGECNIDPGLHPLQVPFVLAHEYAHGYGIGDEGSCNFLAYLSLRTSQTPWIRYSGILGYWRSVAASARRLDRARYRTFFQHLHPGLKQDLRAINRRMDTFPDLFPQTRDRMYTAYLQTQGISEGLANYSRVVRLVSAWRQQHTDFGQFPD